jgi:hypothetical protein
MASPSARPEIEEMLKEKGVTWEFFDEFDVELIDIPKSLANQARIGSPINAEQVDTYEEGMKRGDVFPAIVLYRSGKKYVVIDGNHRVAAAKNTGYNLAAYVVGAKTPAQVIVMLTYEANTKHGLPTSQRERARHAVYLMENAGATMKHAAARMNLPTHYLSNYYSSYRADQRANATGIPAGQWRELHFGTRKKLNQLPDDEVFVAAVNVVFKARLNATEVEELIVALKQLGTANEQKTYLVKYLDDQAERLAQVATGEVRPRRHRPGGPRVSLRQGGAMLESLIGEKRQALLDAMTPIEAKEEVQKLDHVLEVTMELRDALEERAKQ